MGIDRGRGLRRIASWAAAAGLALAGVGLHVGPAVAVAGTTYSVSGTVTLDGGPIPYAHLALFTYDEDADDVEVIDVVHTSTGAFTIPDIEDGTYKLYAAQEDPETGEQPAYEFYNDEARFEDADDIVVLDGDVTLDNIDIESPPTVSGVVHDASGAPAVDVDVQFYDLDDPYDYAFETSTSSTGAFTAPVPEGTYKIELVDYDGRYATEWYADKAAFGSATPVSVTGDLPLGTLTVSAGGAVSGKVTAPGGKPLRRITVSALDTDGSVVATAETTKNGAYTLDRVTPGSYRLAFDDTYGGYASEFYDNQTVLANATPVAITDNATVSGKNAELAPMPVAAPVGTDISGTVLDENGEPVPGVRVYAVPSAGFDDDADTDLTDQSGHYYLTHLDPATSGSTATSFKLYFEDSGLYDDGFCDDDFCECDFDECAPSSPTDDFALIPRWSGDQPTFARAASLTLTPGAPVTSNIALKEYAGASGTVTAEGGARLDEGYVEAYDVDGIRVASSFVAADGSYDLHQLVPGTYRVRFTGYPQYGYEELIPLWWQAGNNFTTATPLAVTSGVDRTGVSGVLLNRLVAYTAPSVTGSPLVGRTLTGKPGVWNLNAGADYTYAWLRKTGSSVRAVGSGPTYKVTAGDVGSTLSLQVTSRIDDYSGVATSKASTAAHYPSTATASAVVVPKTRKKPKRVKVTVRVTSVAGATPTGRAVVTQGSNQVGSGVLSHGRLVVYMANPSAGRHTYAVGFAGDSRFAPSTTRVSITVR